MDKIASTIEQLQELLKQEDPNQLHKLSEKLGQHLELSSEEIDKTRKEIFGDVIPYSLDLQLLQDKLDCFRKDWENHVNTRTQLLMNFARKAQGRSFSKEEVKKLFELCEESAKIKEDIHSYEVTSGTEEA